MRSRFRPYRSHPEWYERDRTDSSAALLDACATLLADDHAAAPFAAALATIEPERHARTGPGREPAGAALLGGEPEPDRPRRAAPARRRARRAASLAGLHAEPELRRVAAVAGVPRALRLRRARGASLGPLRAGRDTPISRSASCCSDPRPPTRPTCILPPSSTCRSARRCWSAAGRPLAERPAGVPIVHLPNEPHETRTGEAPLAALYVWLGELETAAQILER